MREKIGRQQGSKRKRKRKRRRKTNAEKPTKRKKRFKNNLDKFTGAHLEIEEYVTECVTSHSLLQARKESQNTRISKLIADLFSCRKKRKK